MTSVIFDNGSELVSDVPYKTAVYQEAAKITLALAECSDVLRCEAILLLKQLADPSLDEDERHSTMALLVDILFPAGDPSGCHGLDLEEAEVFAKEQDENAVVELHRFDKQELTFAQRLQTLMTEKGLTQEAVAELIGVGQPAISMMLQRQCRPQKRTILRLANALGVTPEDLWPGI